MKFVMTQSICPEGIEKLKADTNGQVEIIAEDNPDPNNYLDDMQDADALIVRIAKCDAHAIENSPKLKVIGRTGVGYDSVDVKKATELGIPVVITPGANNRSVAEHAVAMMFALSKNLYEGQVETEKGNWEIRGVHKAFELEGKTVGVIGLGAIGRETAKICQGVGMKVAGYDPFMSQDKIEALGAEYYADYKELLKVADIVTVHVPLTDQTRDMISAAELATISAALVNNYASGTCQYSYEDFEVIAVFGRAPGDMLFANKASGITSMEDLLEKSKANPNSIKMGMSSGGNTHVYALLLQQAGFACNIVDGGDGSDRIAALVGGHVDVCFVPYLTAKEYVENGDVVPLCTIGDRCSALPDTPSINENGYVENNFNNYYVWLAPKGTDAGIVSYLASLCEDVANNNEKYAADQQAINFNDPFIVTGQDAIDLLAELQDVANENVKVLG